MLEVLFKFKNSWWKILVKEGLSILEIARIENLDIEGSCEGSLACSTCHVLIEENRIKKLSPAKEEEKEMLGLLPDTKNSRLGCQIKINKNLDGIIISIP